jgi:hypothetical protein
MSHSEPAEQRSDHREGESEEEAAVRRETDAARARAEAEIEEARRKGHEDA